MSKRSRIHIAYVLVHYINDEKILIAWMDAMEMIFLRIGYPLPHKEIDSFAFEELLLWVPRKEDRHGKINFLSRGRWHIEPL